MTGHAFYDQSVADRLNRAQDSNATAFGLLAYRALAVWLAADLRGQTCKCEAIECAERRAIVKRLKELVPR